MHQGPPFWREMSNNIFQFFVIRISLFLSSFLNILTILSCLSLFLNKSSYFTSKGMNTCFVSSWHCRRCSWQSTWTLHKSQATSSLNWEAKFFFTLIILDLRANRSSMSLSGISCLGSSFHMKVYSLSAFWTWSVHLQFYSETQEFSFQQHC